MISGQDLTLASYHGRSLNSALKPSRTGPRSRICLGRELADDSALIGPKRLQPPRINTSRLSRSLPSSYFTASGLQKREYYLCGGYQSVPCIARRKLEIPAQRRPGCEGGYCSYNIGECSSATFHQYGARVYNQSKLMPTTWTPKVHSPTWTALT